MTDSAPTDDPTAAELAALRKEKADRDAADNAAREKELEDLRAFKADQEAKAVKAVKAPPRRTEPATPPTTPPATPPAMTTPIKKKRGRGGASRWWFGDEDDRP